MTWRFIHIQNEKMWISGELNTLVQYVLFILDARGRSRTETNMDKLTRPSL